MELEAARGGERIDAGAELTMLFVVVVSRKDAVGTEGSAPCVEIRRDAFAVVARIEEDAIDARRGEHRGCLDGRGADYFDGDAEGAHVRAEDCFDVFDGELRRVALREHVVRATPVIDADQSRAVRVADLPDEGRAPAFPDADLDEYAPDERASEARVPAPFVVREESFDAFHAPLRTMALAVRFGAARPFGSRELLRRFVVFTVLGSSLVASTAARAEDAAHAEDVAPAQAREQDPPPAQLAAPLEQFHFRVARKLRWDDRTGTTWEIGGAPTLTRIIDRREPTDGGTHLGGTAMIGVHRMLLRSPRHESLFGAIEATRWCVPVACFGVGIFFSPRDLMLGNELGVDLRVGGGADLVRAAVRPVLRYAVGRFRTPSYLGFVVPEVGVARMFAAERTFLAVTWPVFPVDVRVNEALAIGIEPFRAGMLVDVGRGGPYLVELSGEVSVRYAP